MSTKYKYHISYSFLDKEGNKHGVATQLYQIGVYAIFDNDPSQQANLSPSQMVKIDKALHKQFEEKEITNLELGRSITVIKDENGFWKEKEYETTTREKTGVTG